MSSRTRLIVFFVSIPIIAFTLIGGYLGQVSAGEDTYRHLRIFEDVVSLISNNYVEDVDLDDVMNGALRGLTEGLDADSAYLSQEDVDRLESGRPLPDGGVGLTVTRRYYIQVVAAHDGSPAAEAAILPGDFIRAIDDEPTRFMSAIEGERKLRGEPGSSVTLSLIRGSTQEPFDIELVRTRMRPVAVTGRILSDSSDGTIGYLRVPGFDEDSVAQISETVTSLTDRGALHLIIDIRNAASGTYRTAVDAARLFVAGGTLVIREEHGGDQTPLEAPTGNDAISTPVTVLINFGSSGPAELFASALTERDRAITVGQRTAGRTSLQKLIRLPDGTGLWLSYARYLKASGDPIHRYGVEPTVPVEVKVPELGETPPPTEDPALERAIQEVQAQGQTRTQAARVTAAA